MAEFVASLTNPTTSATAITCDGTNITIGDWSNYIASTESGHQLGQFVYKKITVTKPDGSNYVLATANFTRDEDINSPSSYIDPLLYPPIETIYAYDGTDGVYVITLLTLPRWKNTYAYQQYDTVMLGGVIYEALQANTDKAPTTETAYWEIVPDEADVKAKYNVTERIAVTCVLNECLANKLKAICRELHVICDDEFLCENAIFRKAMRLDMILASIGVLVQSESWGQITDLINSGNTICNCCD